MFLIYVQYHMVSRLSANGCCHPPVVGSRYSLLDMDQPLRHLGLINLLCGFLSAVGRNHLVNIFYITYKLGVSPYSLQRESRTSIFICVLANTECQYGVCTLIVGFLYITRTEST